MTIWQLDANCDQHLFNFIYTCEGDFKYIYTCEGDSNYIYTCEGDCKYIYTCEGGYQYIYIGEGDSKYIYTSEEDLRISKIRTSTFMLLMLVYHIVYNNVIFKYLSGHILRNMT